MTITKIRSLITHIDFSVLGVDFTILVEYDKKFHITGYDGNTPNHGRIYIQLSYHAPCAKTGLYSDWKGGKWYLSSHMTEDEIVKTCYKAALAAVTHEVMEGFKFDKKIVFNPHVNFRELIAITDKEITRSNGNQNWGV